MKRDVFVYLAYYHTGFRDDAPILIEVCNSEAVALDAIAIHKEQRDRQCEYKDLSHWWTEKRTIRTANSLQMPEHWKIIKQEKKYAIHKTRKTY